MPYQTDSQFMRNFRRLQAEARREKARQEAARIREILGEREEKPRSPLHIVVHEYHCPDCKHRMWSEDALAKDTYCSICGFRGDFRKRED